MARQKGMLNLSGNLEPLAGAPLDSRSITPTVEDLYIASNWPYKYIGMKTTVTATGDTYRLVNLDVTQESSWVNESSGGSGASSLSDLEDVDLINPEEGETLIYDGEGGWTNGPAGQTYSDFTGATAQAVGAHGLVPAPTTGDISKFLKGDGTWSTVPMPSFDYSNTSPEAMNFSTDEKVIGTWIDGKPLYQKIIITTNTTVKNWANVDLSSLNIYEMCNFCGYYTRISNNQHYLYPFHGAESLWNSDNSGGIIRFDKENVGGEITYRINFEATDEQIFILRYTKTTDTAVASGEKIVGQWIDGKPVYEKAISATMPNGNGTLVSTEIPIEKLIDIAFIVGSSDKNVVRGDNTNNGFSMWINSNNECKVENLMAWLKGQSGILFLRYTKTTD